METIETSMNEKTRALGYAVRRLGAEDLPIVARLMGEVYGPRHRSADEAFLRWQYLENPLGEVVGYGAFGLAGDDEGRLVGAYTLIPLPFSFGGRPALGMLSLNTATLPHFERRGIFTNLARLAYARATGLGAVGVLGFPNENSLPVLRDKLGFAVPGRFEAWVLPRRFGALAQKAVSWLQKRYRERVQAREADALGPEASAMTGRSLARAGLERLDRASVGVFSWLAAEGACRVRPIDASLAPLLAAVTSSRPPFTLDHAADWLVWRYGRCPLFDYEAVTDDADDAVVLCRHDTIWGAPTTLLLDYGARFGEPGAERALVRAIRAACRRAAERDTAQVFTIVSAGHPARAALRRAGFLRIPDRLLPHPAHATYLPLGGNPLPPDFPRWALTVGAYDAG